MSKGWKVTFYITTILLSVSMLWGGYLDFTQNPMGVAVLEHLGYPAYFATILGAAKILGVIALWQSKWKFLREWAYAGFVFDTFGALLSHHVVGDAFPLMVPALISLIITLASYISAKKTKRM